VKSIFSFGFSDRQFRSLVSEIAQQFAETKPWTQQELKPELIRTSRITSYWFYMEEID